MSAVRIPASPPANFYRKISVFAASPGDMAEERHRLARVVSRLNDQLAEHFGIRLELKEWRQVAPGMGRPEDFSLDQLPVETWDVFIGLLWLRFGMPLGRNRAGVDHDSGTEGELRLDKLAMLGNMAVFDMAAHGRSLREAAFENNFRQCGFWSGRTDRTR